MTSVVVRIPRPHEIPHGCIVFTLFRIDLRFKVARSAQGHAQLRGNYVQCKGVVSRAPPTVVRVIGWCITSLHLDALNVV